MYINYRLGANEVDLKTAAHAACVQPRAFEDFLKKVRKAIQLDDNQNQQGVMGGVTYRSLVASYVSKDAQDAVEWMEEAEEALPGATLIEYYSTTAVACGVFSWVCDLMEVLFFTFLLVCAYSTRSLALHSNQGDLRRLQYTPANAQGHQERSRPTLR